MKPLTETQKQRLMKAIKYLALSLATAIAMALGLTSCNVTRTITTESRSLTRGDTAIIIQSKTIESYNAKKN
jgi:predicted lysophospholipase L1 biosynthesis ABC-type transport system permease subunit